MAIASYRFPETISFDKTILWQYNNASCLKKLVGMFNDLIDQTAIRPWRLILKSLNLVDGGYESWNNFAFQNDRAGAGDRICFTPNFFGMKQGDALRSVTVRLRYDANISFPLPVGDFYVDLYQRSDTSSALTQVATSDVVTINEGDYGRDVEFLLKVNDTDTKEIPINPSSSYEMVFKKATTGTATSFAISVYKTGTGSPNLYYWRSDLQPIVEFKWIDAELIESRERSLSAISYVFGIPNPGYYPGVQEGISLELWRRYVISQIYLMDCNGSVKDLNSWIKSVMPNRTCRISDNHNMTISFGFTPALDGEDKQLSELPCFFHAPAGVKIVNPGTITDLRFGLTKDESFSASDIGRLNLSRFANDTNGDNQYPPVQT